MNDSAADQSERRYWQVSISYWPVGAKRGRGKENWRYVAASVMASDRGWGGRRGETFFYSQLVVTVWCPNTITVTYSFIVSVSQRCCRLSEICIFFFWTVFPVARLKSWTATPGWKPIRSLFEYKYARRGGTMTNREDEYDYLFKGELRCLSTQPR